MCMGTEDYMKKKFLSILMAATMAASLSACGSADNKPAEESSSAAETKTENETKAPESENSEAEDTITIMVPPVTGTYVDSLDGWIKEYQETHPNIKVEVIATSWDEHISKSTTMALAGEAPDIVEASYSTIGTYAEMGVAVNIEDYLDSSVIADFDQNALNYMTLDNTLYGLPLYISIQALGGNREMLEAAGADVEKIQTEGWSYDEFLEIVKTGTTDDCFGFVFANAGVTTKDFVSIFGVSAGITADFTGDLKYSYTSENMLKLLQAVETMTKSGYMPDYAVEAGQRLVMLETGQAMVSGKAMPLFENNVKKNIAGMSDGSAAEGSIEMEYVFLPVPVMDNVTESCYGTTDGMVVLKNNNTTEEHLKNVCEFMAFLCTGERAAAVDNELYLSCVCESGRTAQASYELDQSELNAKATEREISLVVAPPTGITAEMSANAKTIMDEVIAPKFQSLLAGETDAQSVYDAVCTAAKEAFGEENCASGWIQ